MRLVDKPRGPDEILKRGLTANDDEKSQPLLFVALSLRLLDTSPNATKKKVNCEFGTEWKSREQISFGKVDLASWGEALRFGLNWGKFLVSPRVPELQ